MLQVESNPITETLTEAPVSSPAKNIDLPAAYKLLPAAQVAPEVAAFTEEMPDVVCFADLPWDFVHRRPQHLLSRFAQYGRLFYIEEAVFSNLKEAKLEVTERDGSITIIQAHIPQKLSAKDKTAAQKQLLDQLFIDRAISNYLFWYNTPKALLFTDHFTPELIVYDCRADLSASPELNKLEKRLLDSADLVFTQSQSLCEAKKDQHPHIFAFPNATDITHFAQARTIVEDPADQANIPLIRIGFYGVIDERLDLELLRSLAEAKPELHIVLLGQVVNIDPETLPALPNIHYLGAKDYNDHPAYLSGWDVALIPFAVNENTKFISPEKIPEYLAAGRPVVSTPLPEVVKPFGDMGLVQIAATPEKFAKAVEKALEQNQDMVWQQKTDRFLRELSWDLTWKNMVYLMQLAVTNQLPE